MRRKKLYCVPGIISLIGIPILIFCFIPKPTSSQTVIRCFLPRDEDNPFILSTAAVYKALEGKNIKTMDLKNRNLSNIAEELEKMNESTDTLTVIHLIITNENTFGQVVWIINQTLIHQILKWAWIDHDFYLFNKQKDNLKLEVQKVYPTL